MHTKRHRPRKKKLNIKNTPTIPISYKRLPSGPVPGQTTAQDEEEEDIEMTIHQKLIGVEKSEILAEQWKSWYRQVILLISVFLVGYGYGLDGQVRYIYTGYATASFGEHSLSSTILAITALVAAGAQPVYARLSDIFGRLEIFLVLIAFYVVGTVIECKATSIQIYAAGSVLYQIGYTGAIIIVLFIVSDFSSLKWRLFYLFVPSFPFIINTWISGNVTAAVGQNWRWGIGMWAFIYPLACMPLVACLVHMRYLAGKTERWRVFKQRETKYQELGGLGFAKHLFWKLDFPGLLLLIACLGCILIPLTIAGGDNTKWKQASTAAPFACGWLLVPLFLFWEAKYARSPIVPYYLLKDRGVLAASMMSCLLDVISGIESLYMYTVLLVAVYESEKLATRIVSLLSFVSVLVGMVFGLVIVRVRRLKPFILFGCCLWIVAFALMIRYRSGKASHNGIVAANCILGFGMAFFTYPISVSVQSCVSHENMASAIALLFTLYRVGAAIGSTVAGTMWSGVLEDKLISALGPEFGKIAYKSPYKFILKYTKGTPQRDAMVECYKEVVRLLMIVAICLCVPLLCFALLLRDKRLSDAQSADTEEESLSRTMSVKSTSS